jgi:transcriptional regulator with XRE-family HTH domain
MHFSDSSINQLDSKQLGRRIRSAREDKLLSQEDFGAQVGLDQRAISELENGKRRLTVNELSLFAEILDVPILYFFEELLRSDDLDVALLSEFHRLETPELRKMAVEMIRLLSDTLTN